MKDIVVQLVSLLSEKQLTIGSCESFTAGLFAATIGSVPGASKVFKGALVTYATPLKISLAHVDAKLIQQYGVMSEECALAMAKGARGVLDCDICVSFSGNAGPDAWEGKEAGYVCFGYADALHVEAFSQTIKLERNQLREEAVFIMCKYIYEHLIKSL